MTLFGESSSADVVKLRILSEGDEPEVSRWALKATTVSSRERQSERTRSHRSAQEAERDLKMLTLEIGVTQPQAKGH